MSNSSNGPMLKATGLWAKTSVKGGQYLTGRLGGVTAVNTAALLVHRPQLDFGGIGIDERFNVTEGGRKYG